MPLLASLLSGLFSALGVFFVKAIGFRLPVRLAAVAAIAALATALLALFNGAIAPLVAQAFSTQYGQFIGLAFPPVAGTVMASYFACFLALITYRLQAKAVAITASV